jgi:hypothetical protein
MAADPFTVARSVGRLVEARLFVPRTVQEVGQYGGAMVRAITSAPGKCVICSDWRSASLFAPEVADELVNLLRRANVHFERSAVLLPIEAAMFTLQAERVVREAGSDARRAFRNPGAMREWLSKVLDDAERQRLNEFLVDDPV